MYKFNLALLTMLLLRRGTCASNNSTSPQNCVYGDQIAQVYEEDAKGMLELIPSEYPILKNITGPPFISFAKAAGYAAANLKSDQSCAPVDANSSLADRTRLISAYLAENIGNRIFSLPILRDLPDFIKCPIKKTILIIYSMIGVFAGGLADTGNYWRALDDQDDQ